MTQKDPRTHAIIGAAMEVHNIIGPKHLEAVYQECLEIEFKLRQIPFTSQPRLEIFYKNKKLEKLEQLRVLSNGYKIKVIPTSCICEGVDTPEDFDRFLKRYRLGDQ